MENPKSGSKVDEKSGGLDLTAYRAHLLKFYQDNLSCRFSIDPSKMECTVICPELTLDDYDVSYCERSFSSMNRIRSVLRNRLTHRLLNYLMTISTEGQSLKDFNFDVVVSTYGKKKRPIPKVCQFLKKEEAAEFLPWYTVTNHGHGFLDFARLVDKKLLFSIGSIINIYKDFYLPSTTKSQFIHKMWLGYIGNSSYENLTSTSSVHGQILLSCQHQLVVVDNMTRRPTQLPDWWKNKYEKFAVGRERYSFIKLGRPQNTLHLDVVVEHSDTDENKHTNWLAYPAYCINSINSHISQGHYKGQENICRNWIKRLEMLYLGESLEGDNLVVHIWKEDHVDNRITSHIYKGDSCIFQCIIDYHSSLTTSQL